MHCPSVRNVVTATCVIVVVGHQFTEKAAAMESTGNTGVSYEVGFTTSCYGVFHANEKTSKTLF